jgi:hypothetical protein
LRMDSSSFVAHTWIHRRAQMTRLRKGEQRGAGSSSGVSHPSGGDEGEENRGAEFGTSEPGTAGTNRDADETGESMNQGHGHPREERNRGGE